MLHDALPPLEALQQLVNTPLTEKPPPQNESTVSQYGERLQQLHTEGVEVAAIYQRLQEAGYCGSYWPV